jgi:hypothetical protein
VSIGVSAQDAAGGLLLVSIRLNWSIFVHKWPHRYPVIAEEVAGNAQFGSPPKLEIVREKA